MATTSVDDDRCDRQRGPFGGYPKVIQRRNNTKLAFKQNGVC